MSGIYIPGLAMPTTCLGCFLCRTGCPSVMRRVHDMDKGAWIPSNYRHDDCPIIPVPEHGDLIDKSGVEVLSWTEDPEKDFADGVLFVLDKLDELPVIIPADGEDYKVPADKEGKT